MARKYKSHHPHYIHLDIVIDAIFERADAQGIGFYDLALKANVCYSTLENLCTRRTLFPRYKTIWSLADAVGLTISIMPAPRKYRKVG